MTPLEQEMPVHIHIHIPLENKLSHGPTHPPQATLLLRERLRSGVRDAVAGVRVNASSHFLDLQLMINAFRWKKKCVTERKATIKEKIRN